MQHYTEADLERWGRPAAMEAIESFLVSTGSGTSSAPPRLTEDVRGRTLVFTIGGDESADAAGFRLYSIDRERGTHADSQLVVLLRLSTGEVLATGAGSAFGAWRTAALGACAMRHALAGRADAVGCILGAGFQAFHHARTWAASTPIAALRVWARRPEAAAAFAETLADDVGIPVSVHRSAEAAADTADAVLGVTASRTPIVQADALAHARYVATVGPKFGEHHELPVGAYEGAGVLLGDAVEQCRAYEDTKGPLPGGRRIAEMRSLPDVAAGKIELPPTGRVLFVSEGLAGSEVALLAGLHGGTPR